MRDGQIAVGPLAPRSHAFLPAPLALLRVLSSLGLPLPFSLFLSRSLVPSSSFPVLSICLSWSFFLAPFALLHRHIAPHLYALDVSSHSSPASLILVYTHVRMTHMRHKRRFRLFTLLLSLSFSSSPSIPLVPFSFSDSSLSRTGAHANSRIFPFLSLSPRHPPPLPAPRYSVSLAYARVHIHMCTHARARDRRGYPLRILLSFSRARPNLCANILAHLPRNRTIPPRPVPRLPSASRRTRSFNRAAPRRGGESLVMAS